MGGGVPRVCREWCPRWKNKSGDSKWLCNRQHLTRKFQRRMSSLHWLQLTFTGFFQWRLNNLIVRSAPDKCIDFESYNLGVVTKLQRASERQPRASFPLKGLDTRFDQQWEISAPGGLVKLYPIIAISAMVTSPPHWQKYSVFGTGQLCWHHLYNNTQ